MQDKYDDAIAYLTARPKEIIWAWSGVNHPAHCLFQFVNQTGGKPESYPNNTSVGCLTMIRSQACYVACTPTLTEEIRNDPTIPLTPYEIQPHHLPRFALWQRRLDRQIRGVTASVPQPEAALALA